jgi:hypothetical protein
MEQYRPSNDRAPEQLTRPLWNVADNAFLGRYGIAAVELAEPDQVAPPVQQTKPYDGVLETFVYDTALQGLEKPVRASAATLSGAVAVGAITTAESTLDMPHDDQFDMAAATRRAYTLAA